MKLDRTQVLTKDGSSTLKIEAFRETYHSHHGARTESEFVYIERGLRFWQEANPLLSCSVLEMGYGTGLISYLSYLYHSPSPINYTAIEAYPLSQDEIKLLNYSQCIASEKLHTFDEFSKLSWEQQHQLNANFNFIKREILFEQFNTKQLFDLIFYDAFGAHAQPELWEEQWMKKCYDLLNPKGVWVSYCAKGSVRRALQAVGFEVERLPGPPGKREMLRAVKT